MAGTHPTAEVIDAMAENIDKSFQQHDKVLSDMRVAIAEVQKDVARTAERQSEQFHSLQSIAESMEKLAVVAERQERLQEDHAHVIKTLYGKDGVKDRHDALDRRVRTLETWAAVGKWVIAPAVGVIVAKEALRIWGA